MSAMQRNKGAAGERELAKILRDELGVDITRNLVQSREGGADLLGVAGWAIECKRAATPAIRQWWLQALMQADLADMKPALIYRIDRHGWRAVVALRDVLPAFADQSAMPEWTLEMSLPAWCAVVREGMGDEVQSRTAETP